MAGRVGVGGGSEVGPRSSAADGGVPVRAQFSCCSQCRLTSHTHVSLARSWVLGFPWKWGGTLKACENESRDQQAGHDNEMRACFDWQGQNQVEKEKGKNDASWCPFFFSLGATLEKAL